MDVDGFHIRYMKAGDGPALVCLHGGGGLHLTRAHALLAEKFQVIAFEMPGFGAEENTRHESIQQLAATLARAAEALGLQTFNLLGTSFGGKTALWLTVLRPELITALVLEGPAAIRPENAPPVGGTPEEVARRLYAHPERVAPMPRVDPSVAARRQTLLGRLRGPARDPALEARLGALTLPVLVLFGTRDGVIPPEMGRFYKALIADAHLIFVYDAGHEIGAERPEAFVEAVSDFLERTDAFVINRSATVLSP